MNKIVSSKQKKKKHKFYQTKKKFKKQKKYKKFTIKKLSFIKIKKVTTLNLA